MREALYSQADNLRGIRVGSNVRNWTETELQELEKTTVQVDYNHGALPATDGLADE